MVTIAFFSYVVYDLLHVLEQYPNLGGVDILVHHFGFFTASLLAERRMADCAYMLGWLCTCETSTPLLNLRFFIKSWREMDRTLPHRFVGEDARHDARRGVTAGNWLEYYVASLFSGYSSPFVCWDTEARWSL